MHQRNPERWAMAYFRLDPARGRPTGKHTPAGPLRQGPFRGFLYDRWTSLGNTPFTSCISACDPCHDRICPVQPRLEVVEGCATRDARIRETGNRLYQRFTRKLQVRSYFCRHFAPLGICLLLGWKADGAFSSCWLAGTTVHDAGG